MNALVLANFPIAALVMLAIVGIPLWMTFKRPDRAPDYVQASPVRTVTTAGRPARTGLAPVPQHALAGTGAARTNTARATAGRTAQRTRVAA